MCQKENIKQGYQTCINVMKQLENVSFHKKYLNNVKILWVHFTKLQSWKTLLPNNYGS